MRVGFWSRICASSLAVMGISPVALVTLVISGCAARQKIVGPGDSFRYEKDAIVLLSDGGTVAVKTVRVAGDSLKMLSVTRAGLFRKQQEELTVPFSAVHKVVPDGNARMVQGAQIGGAVGALLGVVVTLPFTGSGAPEDDEMTGGLFSVMLPVTFLLSSVFAVSGGIIGAVTTPEFVFESFASPSSGDKDLPEQDATDRAAEGGSKESGTSTGKGSGPRR